jgi:hypothetical protein
MIFFFIVGGFLLFWVDIEKALRDAKEVDEGEYIS